MASSRTSVPRPASSSSLPIIDQNETENFSGSQSPFRLSYTVLQEKRARKAAEEDAVRLCNRVKQLQKESERASKRVNDTKKKIFDVRSQQQRIVDLKVNFRAHAQDTPFWDIAGISIPSPLYQLVRQSIAHA